MKVTRYWKDADGTVGAEEATWLPAPDGVTPAPGPLALIEATSAEGGGTLFALLSVNTLAADPAAFLAGDANALYAAALPDGREIVSGDDYAAAVAARDAAADAKRTEISERLAQGNPDDGTARDAALTKLRGLGLTDDDLAALGLTR